MKLWNPVVPQSSLNTNYSTLFSIPYQKIRQSIHALQNRVYKTHRVGIDAANHLDGHLSYGVLPFLAMIRLWLACSVENITARGVRYLRAVEAKALQDAADIASGKTRAPALIPESARAAEAPKIMLGRRARRILARGLPASRRYGWYRFACNRTLNGNQFFELVSKISGNGRAVVYGLEYRLRLCQRRLSQRRLASAVTLAPLTDSLDSVSIGLSPNHLWPD